MTTGLLPKTTGLLGYPIAHSLSPAIHNAAYKALGLNWHYELFSCPNTYDFSAFLNKALVQAKQFVGLNVTTPYKALAHELAGERTATVALAKSANVLSVLPQGRQEGEGSLGSAGNLGNQNTFGHLLQADNTDGQGLVTFLERDGGVAVSKSEFLICGSGSVAFAALLALLQKQALGVTLVSRDVQNAKQRVAVLCERFIQAQPVSLLVDKEAPTATGAVRVINYAQIATVLPSVHVVINATSVGRNPTDKLLFSEQLFRPHMVFLDTIYGYGKTPFVQAAEKQGARAYNGLGMLIEQAALSIEIWAQAQGLKLTAPRDVMTAAVYDTCSHIE